MTVATNSYYQKVLLYDALTKTSDSTDALPFQLHDFGYRGSTSVEVLLCLLYLHVYLIFTTHDIVARSPL